MNGNMVPVTWVRCAVPGCPRKHHQMVDEAIGREQKWMCRQHWSLTDTRYRLVFHRAVRHVRTAFYRGFQLQPEWETIQRIWRKLERQAIERSAGIG